MCGREYRLTNVPLLLRTAHRRMIFPACRRGRPHLLRRAGRGGGGSRLGAGQLASAIASTATPSGASTTPTRYDRGRLQAKLAAVAAAALGDHLELAADVYAVELEDRSIFDY
jgi:hypothetical protein